MRVQRVLLAIATAAAAVLGTGAAAAQSTITVPTQEPTRLGSERKDSEQPTWISRADCEFNGVGDVLSFNGVTITDPTGKTLEVWGARGSDCTDPEQRKSNAEACWKLYSEPAETSQTVPIRMQDVVGEHFPPAEPGSGILADCDADYSTSTPREVTVYFLVIDSSTTTVESSASRAVTYDVVGPSAPTGVSAGVGEDKLILKWDDASDNSDVASYRFYCDPAPGGTAASALSAADGGLDGSFLDGAADGAAGTSAAGATGAGGSVIDPVDSGASGTAGAAATAGTGGETFTSCLPGTSALVPGSAPPEANRCGSVSGTTVTEGRATGLTNFTEYGVAVAAVDAVGNVGPLSSVVCESPQPVDDFFEVYARAGGKGGGGFCAIGSQRGTALAGLFGIALLAGAARRRSTRGRSRRSTCRSAHR